MEVQIIFSQPFGEPVVVFQVEGKLSRPVDAHLTNKWVAYTPLGSLLVLLSLIGTLISGHGTSSR